MNFGTKNCILQQCDMLQHHQIRFSQETGKMAPLVFLTLAGVGIAEKIANFPVCDTNGKGWMLVLGKSPDL